MNHVHNSWDELHVCMHYFNVMSFCIDSYFLKFYDKSIKKTWTTLNFNDNQWSIGLEYKLFMIHFMI